MPENEDKPDTERVRKRIEERAYVLWEQEGRPEGCDLDHWLRAGAEIAAGGAEQPNPAASAARPGRNPEKSGG